ncbi:MAG: phosphoribosylformylglycinamidine synthase I [Candidatus Micrarchaeota archaeon]
MVKACILTGFGINCDYETAAAFVKAGARAERVHLNDLIARSKQLEDFEILAFPGGFSYGDDLGSAKVWANKFSQNLHDEFIEFVNAGKLVIGICNGFQALVKMGALPALDGDYASQQATLTFNDSGRFEDRWVSLKALESKCVWTRGIESLDVPVRHGEGKFVASDDVLKKLAGNKQIVFQYAKENEPTQDYPENPNGAMNAIAGICDPSGRVFGLMPHPEAFTINELHPHWTRKQPNGNGSKIFENAVSYVD